MFGEESVEVVTSAERDPFPETATLTVQIGILCWQNRSISISADQLAAVCDQVLAYLRRDDVSGLLVDNRLADGTWPVETTDTWGELMADLHRLESPCAIIAASRASMNQLNRHASEREGTDLIEAFPPAEWMDAGEFVVSRTMTETA